MKIMFIVSVVVVAVVVLGSVGLGIREVLTEYVATPAGAVQLSRLTASLESISWDTPPQSPPSLDTDPAFWTIENPVAWIFELARGNK